MKVGKFLSKYVRAADIKDSGPQTVTITSVEEETVGQGEDKEDKPVLYTKELEQGIVLNRSNIRILAELLESEETDDWRGKRVEMFHDPSILFKGKRIGGIRFREANS